MDASNFENVDCTETEMFQSNFQVTLILRATSSLNFNKNRNKAIFKQEP